MCTHFSPADRAPATGRIEDRDAAPVNAFEDNVVIQIPMQDHRATQISEFIGLEPERPRMETEAPGDLHELAQTDATPGIPRALTKRGQIDMPPMMAGNHRQACKTALGLLGLHDKRCSRRTPIHPHMRWGQPLHSRPRSARMGSKIQRQSVRFSRRRSASSAMPACSGTSRPYASTQSRSGRTRTL